MIRPLFAAAVLAAGLGAFASPAAAFRASNGMTVAPADNGSFVVSAGSAQNRGATDFWCAAAQYAQRHLGLGAGDRVWRLSEPPRRRGEGIRFSIGSEGAASDSGVFRFGGQRADFSIAHATSFCEPVRLFRVD